MRSYSEHTVAWTAEIQNSQGEMVAVLQLCLRCDDGGSKAFPLNWQSMLEIAQKGNEEMKQVIVKAIRILYNEQEADFNRSSVKNCCRTGMRVEKRLKRLGKSDFFKNFKRYPKEVKQDSLMVTTSKGTKRKAYVFDDPKNELKGGEDHHLLRRSFECK